jgi:hypothetical protein
MFMQSEKPNNGGSGVLTFHRSGIVFKLMLTHCI